MDMEYIKQKLFLQHGFILTFGIFFAGLGIAFVENLANPKTMILFGIICIISLIGFWFNYNVLVKLLENENGTRL